jgi:hypothetical protein
MLKSKEGVFVLLVLNLRVEMISKLFISRMFYLLLWWLRYLNRRRSSVLGRNRGSIIASQFLRCRYEKRAQNCVSLAIEYAL